MVDAAPLDAATDSKLWQAARRFETMAVGQMLKPMFDTVDLAGTAFGGGDGERAWAPMLVDAIAKQATARGGFGLANAVHAELLRMQEQGGPARRNR